MSTRLPRFLRGIPLVGEKGSASITFHQWWEQAMSQIESSIERIDLALSAAGVAIDGSSSSKEVTASETLLTTDRLVFVDASSGAVTVTLPPADDVGSWRISIKKTDSSVNAVTVDADGSETIDGATTVSLPNQYDSVTISSFNSEWHIL